MQWDVDSGTLPDGLKLEKSSNGLSGLRTAVISGTPTRSGTYKFTMRVAAGNRVCVGLDPLPDEYASKEFTIQIGLPIDSTNFPDKVFREYISSYVDSDRDGFLSISEIASRTSLYLGKSSSASESEKISSLEGIEYLTALKTLYCDYNKLTEIDLSKNTALTSLNCANNQLKKLNLANNKELKTLNCNNNSLLELDISNNLELTLLRCYSNSLVKLDLSKNSKLSNVYLGEGANQSRTVVLEGNKFDFADLGFTNNDMAKISDVMRQFLIR